MKGGLSMFLKTKFYPVDIHHKIIYDDPANRERDCSIDRGYRGKGTIGIKGDRLNQHACYREFTVIEKAV